MLAPVELDEKTIQSLIDEAPEPLKRLGEYLTEVLDADQWNHAEQYLLAMAAATRAALKSERASIADEARRYASHYKPGSDGRNTFVMLAEWIDSRECAVSQDQR